LANEDVVVVEKMVILTWADGSAWEALKSNNVGDLELG
jgi:hypothetical protein